MKKLIFKGFMLLFVSFALSAQQGPEITFVNNTGFDFYFIFAKPANNANWDSSVEFLGDDILRNGQSLRARLQLPLNRANSYDFVAISCDYDV